MTRPNTECSFCRKPLYRRPSHKGERVWCSTRCRGRLTGTIKNCPSCKREFYNPSSSQIHCSRACANAGRRGLKYDGSKQKDKKNTIDRQRELLAAQRGYRCEACGLGAIWNGKFIVLQVDHINADRTNNALENLRLLCPNCHTQTDTYARGKKFYRGSQTGSGPARS